MGFLKRRRNTWAKDVIENEAGLSGEHIDENVAADVIFNESFPDSEFAADDRLDQTHSEFAADDRLDQTHSEFAADDRLDQTHSEFAADDRLDQTHSEFAADFDPANEDVNVGVSENAPYKNLAKYKMVAPSDDEGTISTHSS